MIIELTFAEVRRLYHSVADPIVTIVKDVWEWSGWRRRHQAVAKYHHYRAREQPT